MATLYYTRRATPPPGLRPYVGGLSRVRLDAAPEIDMNIDKQTPLALAREEGPFLLLLRKMLTWGRCQPSTRSAWPANDRDGAVGQRLGRTAGEEESGKRGRASSAGGARNAA